MIRPSAHSIRKAITITLGLVVIIAIGVPILLSKIDLDDYRHDLEQELSEILAQPVTIGRSSLTYQHGLALALDELRIGQQAAPLAIVPHLTATLKLKPLLSGQVVLDRVYIDSPKLHVQLPVIQQPRRGTTYQLMDRLGIRILTIQNADLQIDQRRDKGSQQLLHLDNLYLVLSGWEAEKNGRLTISGQYPQAEQPANFTIDLSLPSSSSPGAWRNEKLHYQLKVKNFSTAKLPKPSGRTVPKHIDLTATLDGIPAAGVNLVAKLRNHTDQKELFKLNAHWLSSAEQELLSPLSAVLMGLPLNGEFRLHRANQLQLLSGKLGSEPTELTPELLTRWHIPKAEKLLAGQLEEFSLSLQHQWDADKKPTSLPQIGAAVTIANLEWDSPELRQLQDLSIDLTLQDQQLVVKDSLVVIGGHLIWLTGTVNSLLQQPELNLKLLLEPQLTPLKQQLSLPTDWQLAGDCPVTLQLSGAVNAPKFRFNLELASATLGLGNLLQKPAGQTARLTAEGLINSQQLQIDKLRLQLGNFKLSGEGLFPLKDIGQRFRFDLDEFDLAQLQQQSPLLKKLQLVGKTHIYLDRNNNGIHANLQLSNVGAHLFNIVADLNNVSGAINIDQQGLNFSKLNASLGQSPLNVSGSLSSWKDPQLKLAIKGSKVRAQDLIFRNQQLTLYDLDGKLRITAKDLFFEPVSVRLEKSTTATVTGKVANFKDPQTLLDITAEQADILNVIKLFIGPEKGPARTPRKDYKPLIINVSAAKGTLGGLRFNHAEGTITDKHGVFTIYPLSFKSGPGYCFARIEIDRNQKEGLLKISGHAEDLDASVLHEDVFLSRGLVSGRLRGNFYLEGKPGQDFWPTAAGGIHLQLKDGTLRKFRGLAQVFSILNVSQLFAFKLPDMDDEGMPFDLLEGSIRVADGHMTTRDMHVISEAMNLSMVGTKDLLNDTVDFDLAVMPLRTIDKVITSIPVAGWILTGENKALVSAQFKIQGPSNAPKVSAVPISSVSDTVFGIVKRTIGLPVKLIKDIDAFFKQKPQKK